MSMSNRIWSKKIVAVLRYYRLNPHTTLFGVTGDLDNLGVYVAKNGRAKAEVLVDTYNRVIGSVLYEFLGMHPQKFYEVQFLPSGEEIFILGTCAAVQDAHDLFQNLKETPVPQILVEAGLDSNIATTDISFGCRVLDSVIDMKLIDDMLENIDRNDVIGANKTYIKLIEQVREVLAYQLDIEKFNNISLDSQIIILLRNIVYAKTLQYKESTRSLLLKLSSRFATDPGSLTQYINLLSKEYGLRDRDHQEILQELEK